MNVFRPADTVETAEAWEIALGSATTPSVLALTRQNLPILRTRHSRQNLTARGAYVLAEAEGRRRVIRGHGLQAKHRHEWASGRALVSMPCWELFEAQDEKYRRSVLPQGPVRVAVEAALEFGWERWLDGERGSAKKAGFVGMTSFAPPARSRSLRAFRHHRGGGRKGRGAAGRGCGKGGRGPAGPGLFLDGSCNRDNGGTMGWKTLDDLDLGGKVVLTGSTSTCRSRRAEVTDATRIERIVPTVKDILAKGGKPVLLAHFDRPKGKVVPEMSLKVTLPALSAALPAGGLRRGLRRSRGGGGGQGAGRGRGVLLLENTRFHKGEEKNDPDFAAELAALGDVYCNDAFSAAHRAHASTEGLALLPSCAGRLMQAELSALEKALAAPDRPWWWRWSAGPRS